jgi:hypothetical protein
MAYARRLPPRRLTRDYRTAARVGDWRACQLIIVQLYRCRLEGETLAEVIYADGYCREHAGDTDNARRCYALAAEKGHTRAARRLAALGGPVPVVPPLRNY